MEKFCEIKCRMSTGVAVEDFSALDSVHVSKKLKMMNNCGSPDGSNNVLDRSTALGVYADGFEEEMLADDKMEVVTDENPATAYFHLRLESEDAESNTPRLKTCTARFGGLEDMDSLDDFLFKASCYKLRFDIADDKAIGDLEFLLHGVAKTWWNSISVKPLTWSEATLLIKQTFDISPLVQQHFAYYGYGMAQQRRRPAIDYLPYC